MKMSCLRVLTAVFCLAFLAIVAASGDDKTKAVGDEVSFRPTAAVSRENNIIWKHKNKDSGTVIVAIELDDGKIISKSPHFKDVTGLNMDTGEITIKNLTLFHSGLYTIDINSKQQKQEFTLTVKERVPKPKITIEDYPNPDVAYLRCDYNESVTMDLSIIWRDSSGVELQTQTNKERTNTYTAKKSEDTENYYTCTLDNIASNATSEQLKEAELFKGTSGSTTLGIVVGVLSLIFGIPAVLAILYKFNKTFRDFIRPRLPCTRGNANVGGAAAPKNHVLLQPDPSKTSNGGDVESQNAGAPLTGGSQDQPNCNDSLL